MASLHYHSTRVYFLRWILPVLALVVLVLAVAWPQLKEMRIDQLSRASSTRLKVESIAVSAPQTGKPLELQVSHPEYSGRDDEGRPYVITATRVIQQGLQPGQASMQLEQPHAQLILHQDSNENVVVTSTTGFYDAKAKTLQLNGAVTLIHSAGYEMHCQDLLVDITAGSGKTDNPVDGNGPAGTLRAERFELLDKGNRIILKGRSKIVLTPQPKTDQENG